MKTITIVVPTYNESENIHYAYTEITKVMNDQLPHYDYHLLFIDNHSTDNTRQLIEALCEEDARHVRAIFNARNFGQQRSHFYGLTQATGDCAILMHADLQNPPALIPQFVDAWEAGHKCVIGIKDSSKENPIMFFLRGCFYKVMRMTSDVELIEHFSDFELLDRDFLEVLRNLDDTVPYLRGIVSELGFNMKRIHYVQNKREKGKSKAKLGVLYDFAMTGITSYSKGIMRLATIIGAVLSMVSLVVALITLIIKLIYWDSFLLGSAATTVGVFTLGSVQLFFIGLLSEYILSINTRIMKRPLVIEEKRVNFDC